MHENDSLQDDEVDDLVESQVFSSVYLKNGLKLRGHLIGHDKTFIFLKERSTQMIFKHRISAIKPVGPFFLFQSKRKLLG